MNESGRRQLVDDFTLGFDAGMRGDLKPSGVNAADRIQAAVDLALRYGQIDGAHHKTWVIDQIVRTLTGDDYDAVIERYRQVEDGEDMYEWDEGIAP